MKAQGFRKYMTYWIKVLFTNFYDFFKILPAFLPADADSGVKWDAGPS